MGNFFSDNQELLSLFEGDKASLEALLSIGDLAANFIAPFAGAVDKEGPSLVKNEVRLAAPTAAALGKIAEAGLMGFCLPREYGGLGLNFAALCAAQEILARADPSFLNFGIQQDIGLLITKFGSVEQKAAILPRLASGEWDGCMALTEAGAGSDLQAVRLRASRGEDGRWHLNGRKRFITNGCGKLALVLARSGDSPGARGLSLFVCQKTESLIVRRLEHKIGIRGSATCEIEFKDAPAELLGEERRGLTKYSLYLMNAARLGVAAQSVGIAEAAYREAKAWAAKRKQFGAPVGSQGQVMMLLAQMGAAIAGGRALLYESARLAGMRESAGSASYKEYSRLANFFTPLAKAWTSEMANRAAYNALQIHGGSGCCTGFAVERLYRDVRVTSIYEGTTQMQVNAALGGIRNGTAALALDEYQAATTLSEARALFDEAARHVLASPETEAFYGRVLVEMAAELLISCLLLRDSGRGPSSLARIFAAAALPKIRACRDFILSGDTTLIREICGQAPGPCPAAAPPGKRPCAISTFNL
jgi:alkylation response protein AidB-like acyl-CoA dehydrogenase